MNGHAGDGLTLKHAAFIFGGLALVGVAGWLMGPSQPERDGKTRPSRESNEGLKIVPKEGNFIVPKQDTDEESDDGTPLHTVFSS